jgi:hypothetical protein
LQDVADAGESASAPFIEVGAIARWLLPFALLMIGIVLGIYFALRWPRVTSNLASGSPAASAS